MAKVLDALLRRVSEPSLASTLTKEELCLAFSALGRLAPLELKRPTEALAQRSEYMARRCSAREISMIASGCVALRWTRPTLMDALIATAYHRHYVKKASTPMRLGDLAVLAAGALSMGHTHNTTLHHMVELAGEGGASILAQGSSSHGAGNFLRVAREVLRENKKGRSALLQMMRANLAQDAQLQSWMAEWEDTASATPEHSPTRTAREGDDPIEWSSEAARRAIFHHLLAGPSTSPQSSMEELAQMAELFIHFAIDDPVARLSMEDELLAAMRTASPSEVRGVSRVVYEAPNSFPRVCRALEDLMQGSSSSAADSTTALKPVSPVRALYAASLTGTSVEDGAMAQLAEKMHDWCPDEVAMAACLFSHHNTIPEQLTRELSAVVADLTPQGIAAAIRAAYGDCTAGLAHVAEAALGRITIPLLTSTTTEDLRSVLVVLSEPFPRYYAQGAVVAKRRAQAMEAAQIHVLTLVDVLPLAEAMSIVTEACGIDGMRDAVMMMCERLVAEETNALIPLDTCSAMMRLLVKADHIHEPLLDRLAASYRQHFFTAETSAPCLVQDFAVDEALMDFAHQQSLLDAPELDGLTHLIMATVQRNAVKATSAQLAACGLLQVQTMAVSTAATQHALLHHMEHVTEHLSPLTSIINFLYACSEVSVELVRIVLERTDELLSQHQGTSIPLGAEHVAKAVVLHARCFCESETAAESSLAAIKSAAPPASFFAFLEPRLWALKDSAVLTEVCSCVYRCGANAFASVLLTHVVKRLDGLSPTQICQCMYGLSMVSDAGQRLTHQLACGDASDYVMDHVDLFWSGCDISQLLGGFARLHCTKRSLYAVFADRLSNRATLATLNRESVSRLFAAFGAVKYLDKALMDRLARAFTAHAKDLATVDMVLAVKGNSRLMLLNDDFYDELGNQLACRANQLSLNACCDVVKAYGGVEKPHSFLADACAERIADSVELLPHANAATDIMTALWLMDYDISAKQPTLRLAEYISTNSSQLDNQSILKLCSVMHDVDWRHDGLLRALAERSVTLKNEQQITGESCRAVLDVLAKYLTHNHTARLELSTLARSVSKESVALSESEQQQFNLLLER